MRKSVRKMCYVILLIYYTQPSNMSVRSSLHKDVFKRIEKNTFYYIIMDGKVDASEKPLRNEMAGYRRNMQTKCILLLLWYTHSFHFHWSQLTKWLRSSRAVAVTFDANKAKWQERTFFTICKLVSFSIHSLTLGFFYLNYFQQHLILIIVTNTHFDEYLSVLSDSIATPWHFPTESKNLLTW